MKVRKSLWRVLGIVGNYNDEKIVRGKRGYEFSSKRKSPVKISLHGHQYSLVPQKCVMPSEQI
jgi:hypothetical protein